MRPMESCGRRRPLEMNGRATSWQGWANSEVSPWQCTLTYVQEQVLIFQIDQLPWPMESGVRRQAWPTSVVPEWTGPLRRVMGAASVAPTLVFELWHARGEVLPGDLQGASALLPLRGGAVLRQGDISLLLPRGAAVRWPRGSPGTSAVWYVPSQRQFRWGGHGRHLGPHVVAGNGRCTPPWGAGGHGGGPAECFLKGEGGGPGGQSSCSASGSEDWDSGQEVTDGKAPRHGFPLQPGVLNVRGWARKRAEVEPTMRRRHLDVLGMTETHSHRQGWPFAPSHSVGIGCRGRGGEGCASAGGGGVDLVP